MDTLGALRVPVMSLPKTWPRAELALHCSAWLDFGTFTPITSFFLLVFFFVSAPPWGLMPPLSVYCHFSEQSWSLKYQGLVLFWWLTLPSPLPCCMPETWTEIRGASHQDPLRFPGLAWLQPTLGERVRLFLHVATLAVPVGWGMQSEKEWAQVPGEKE